MSRMADARCRAAVMAGRLAALAYRMSGRRGDGVSTRGRAILAVDPEAIATLSRGRSTILVTGTNGKTTTTYLTVAAIGGAATNPTGANMRSGIVTAYADSAASLAVVEVDELYLPSVLTEVRPRAVVLLNLARDQLDRMHEVKRISDRWRSGLDGADAVIIANAADPNVVYAASRSTCVWFDPGTRWTHDAAVCPRCDGLIRWDVAQSWSCSCGLAMPTAEAWVEPDGVHLADGRCAPLVLAVPGVENRGNAIAAALAAAQLGVSVEDAVSRMAEVDKADGRFAMIQVGGRRARLVLGKNPASWSCVMSWLGDRPVIVMVNAQEADGRDTSWLFDVPFECFVGKTVGACGERADDVALRLHLAGVDVVVNRDLDALARAMPEGELQVVATYSAFKLLRRRQWAPQ